MDLEYWEAQRLRLRQKVLYHPLFQALREPHQLKVFMEAHVFAVWDFMSLVKRLQRELCCIELPWLPPNDAKSARLINEIVLGEETDTDERGGYLSHFELYLEAMRDMKADTSVIEHFVGSLRHGQSWLSALADASCPEAVKGFTRATLEVACQGTREEVLGAFFFAREELIPAMFQRLLDTWSLDEATIPRFCYYLKRHIQLDQDEHGPAAEQLIQRLLGNNRDARTQMMRAACVALEARLRLWDSVLDQLPSLVGKDSIS
jgi:hypothetical protein